MSDADRITDSVTRTYVLHHASTYVVVGSTVEYLSLSFDLDDGRQDEDDESLHTT